MKGWRGISLVAGAIFSAAYAVPRAEAQAYYQGAQPYTSQPNPCSYRPQGGLFGAILDPLMQAKRTADCRNYLRELRYNQQQRDAARQAQLAQEEAAAEAERKAGVEKEQATEREEAAAEARQETLAAAHAKRVAQDRDRARKVSEQQEQAAEASSDNHCKSPAFAKALIEQFNQFKPMKTVDEQVIDIEHVTTRKFDVDNGDIVCHGTFETTSGLEMTGNVEVKKNIAGEPIIVWKPDR